jgi:chemotaxis protein histidine kinase CheA
LASLSVDDVSEAVTSRRRLRSPLARSSRRARSAHGAAPRASNRSRAARSGARDSYIHLSATTDDGTLILLVRDDGVGGDDQSGGSGLVGLEDRVEALSGTIEIDSPAGRGTSLMVALPIATGPDG